MARPRSGPGFAGFLQNTVLAYGLGFAIGQAAAEAFTPPFRELGYIGNRALPNVVLTPEQLAEAVIRNLIPMGQASSEARESGIDANRFEILTLLAGNPPGPGELLQLLNRDKIDDARFERGIRQGRIRNEWIPYLKELRRQLLSPDIAAQMVVQGILPTPSAIQIGTQQGIIPEDMARLIQVHGNPVAPGEALDLWNRGEISEDDVNRALRQSRLKPEWVEDFKKLRRQILTPSDMIRAAVREAYTPEVVQRFGLDEDFPERFRSEVAKHGLLEDEAQILWRAHWDLPSPEQGFAMLWRKEASEDELELLLRTRDVMPFWRPKLQAIAYHLPGRIDTRRMLQEGIITEAQAQTNYEGLGYRPEHAKQLVLFAKRQKLTTERDLTKAEIVGLYSEDSIERTQAKSMLTDLGYEDDESEQILTLADARKARAFRNAVVAVVRRRYIEGEIDEGIARERMSTQGVRQEAQDRYLELWDFERAENPRHITEAQMRAAWIRGIVDESRYRAHLAMLMIPADEAEILATLYRPRQAA